MATLHMDVETARNAQNNMANTHQQMASLLQSMSAVIGNLQAGAWMGPSATEFFQLYDQWKSGMNSTLENLSQMATRLQAEINEWEQVGSRL